MQTDKLSEPAICLLRRRIAGEWVVVDEETQPIYRELVDAGLMEPLNSFARGADGAFRLTEAACRFRDGINGHASRVPSA
jgi:hypothetical protein